MKRILAALTAFVSAVAMASVPALPAAAATPGVIVSNIAVTSVGAEVTVTYDRALAVECPTLGFVRISYHEAGSAPDDSAGLVSEQWVQVTSAGAASTTTTLASGEYYVMFISQNVNGFDPCPSSVPDQIPSFGPSAEFTVDYVFADVSDEHVFRTFIEWMRSENISNGYLDEAGIRTYRPLEDVSRQAMAAFLYRMAGEPSFTAPAVASFSDVPVGALFYHEIEWLKASTITTGNADGTFSPLDAVSRQAMAAFLYRFAGRPEFTPVGQSFTDVAPGTPFAVEIEWLKSEEITTGYDDGETFSYHPVENVTRQAMAAFLYRSEH